MMRPDVIRENALYLAGNVERALAARLAEHERERLLDALSGHLHVAGIAALLADAAAAAFRSHLSRSGEVRRELLQIPARTRRAPGRLLRASHLAPFFDAVVAAADPVAAEVARLSPDACMADEEFEDDFWYAQFLHALVLASAEPVIGRALDEMGRACGEPTPRLEACVALHEGDGDGFGEALAAILRERNADLQEAEQMPLRDPERHYADKHVFVEGLALLWLAQSRGLVFEATADTLPMIARRVSGPR
jgi:hypothetical protein